MPDGSPYTYCVGKNESAIEDDVLARFSSSMNKYNITHGFYYSFTNNFYLNVQDHFAGHSHKLLKGQVNVSQKQFESIALDQVSELWSNYGQLGEIWYASNCICCSGANHVHRIAVVLPFVAHRMPLLAGLMGAMVAMSALRSRHWSRNRSWQ